MGRMSELAAARDEAARLTEGPAMEEFIDNPNAFPTHGTMGEVAQQGMTLRDHFAGLAMAALIVSPATAEQCYGSDEKMAAWAYLAADAMLKARAAK